MTTTTDSETYLRVTLGADSVSVRVLYTVTPIHSQHDDDLHRRFLYNDVQIHGIFRLDDDSEVPFTSLSLSDQQKTETKCENEYIKEQNMAETPSQ